MAEIDVFLYDFQNNKLLFSNFLAYFFLAYCLGKILRKKNTFFNPKIVITL